MTMTTDVEAVMPSQECPRLSQLTPDQLERIERNRLEAIKRREAAIRRDALAHVPAIAANMLGSVNSSTPFKKRKVEHAILPGSLPPPYIPAVTQSEQVDEPKRQDSEKNSDVKFSEEQIQALRAVAMRNSVFLTGCAGTGKSFVLEFAIRSLRAMHGSDTVYVTASTGLAACALSGTTLHSFAGVGLGIGSKEELMHKVQTRREARQRWQGARALVIDEISMIDAQFFENLEFIARKIRKTAKPFGGIQLLVTGDFFQLPPVNPQSNVAYAFEAKCWNDCFNLQMELKHVFRQSDLTFVSMLNEIREGIVTPATHEKLRKRICCAPIGNDGIMLTKLYPYKADVAGENFQRLQELQELEMVYNAKDEGKSEYAKKQLEFTRAEKRLTLRRGAQVMLIKNLDTPQGLVNGARGVVVGFCDPANPCAAQFRHLVPIINPSAMWPVVRFACDQSERIIGPESWAVEEYGNEIAKRWQVPLTLAWALSVHKCQGMTLDRVETDLKRAFDYGMVYVALSRVRSLEGLRLLGFDAGKVKVNAKVVEFYKQLQRHDASSEKAFEV